MIISHRRTTIIKTLVISITLIAAGIGGWTYLQPTSRAADLKNFDPGNIISDTVMSNKSSMTVQQIQAFLESKNSCNNTNTYMASWYPNLQYNIKDGKFVCMAKESFDGQSAAQIIWQVSQDHNINPQVLIVLLEKEQGLITDTWPNHAQYRAAVGYACPDTAACDSQYYGLKNQLNQAAKLFRTVLDGGWSNYPVGQTYVQYNPNVACGGSVINIQNRATSALYRYTPYQPNQSALNAGYGTGDSCGAYGNRNFWLLFTDWFGSTIYVKEWSPMSRPRSLSTRVTTKKIDPTTNLYITDQTIEMGQIVKYSSLTYLSDGKLCLRTESNTATDSDMCVVYDDLSEFMPMKNPRELSAKTNTSKIHPVTKNNMPNQIISRNQVVRYTSRADLSDGKLCLRTESNTATDSDMCVVYDDLSEKVLLFSEMVAPRSLKTNGRTYKIDLLTRERVEPLPGDLEIQFQTLYHVDSSDLCLRTKIDTELNKPTCLFYSDLKEIP